LPSWGTAEVAELGRRGGLPTWGTAEVCRAGAPRSSAAYTSAVYGGAGSYWM
jgi:hypothetical protein